MMLSGWLYLHRELLYRDAWVYSLFSFMKMQISYILQNLVSQMTVNDIQKHIFLFCVPSPLAVTVRQVVSLPPK